MSRQSRKKRNKAKEWLVEGDDDKAKEGENAKSKAKRRKPETPEGKG